MSTFERYVFRQLLGPFGFFVLVLTGVIWLTQSLRIIDLVVNNGQGARVFLEFTALLLPVVLSIVLQLGALAATVYALHRLASDSELTAAFACGASRLRVARPVAAFGALMVVVLAVDTLYLMPTAARVLRERLAEVRGDLAAGFLRDGRFLTPANGLTVYIREITADGELHGVLVQDSRDRASPLTYTAKRGYLTRDEGATALVLFDGQAQRLEQNGARLSLLRFDSFVYDLSSFAEREAERARKPSERYFWELVDPDPAETPTPRDRARFLAEGHEQLSAPLYGLALPMVAAAALLGAAYSRRGMGGAVASAIVLGAGLRVAGLAAKSAVAGAAELWPLLYAPPILGVIGALWALSRTPGPRPRGGRGDAPGGGGVLPARRDPAPAVAR